MLQPYISLLHSADPTIPLNLYNQIFNNINYETHIFTQNILNKLIEYLNSFLEKPEDIIEPSIKNIPEPKIESYLTINGYKLPIVDSNTWYNNPYIKLILYLTFCSGVITLVWYNGESIKEWSIFTSSVTILLKIIEIILGKTR